MIPDSCRTRLFISMGITYLNIHVIRGVTCTLSLIFFCCVIDMFSGETKMQQIRVQLSVSIIKLILGLLPGQHGLN